MYQECSQSFNAAIEKTARTFKARIKINGKWYSEGIKTATLNAGSNSEDNISIGSAVSSYVDVTMKDIGELFESTEIEFQEGVQLPDKTIEYIRMGFFTAQKPTDDNGSIKFTAYDRMTKAETVYSSKLDYPATALQVLDEACAESGLVRATTGLGTIYIQTKPEGYTCREIFGYIASLYGKFACIDRNGKLQLKWYEDSGYTVGVSRTWSLSKNQSDYVVGNIKCNTDKSTQLVKGDGARGITFDNPWMTDYQLSTIFKKVNTFTYRPGSVNFLGDIRLDVWDLITVVDLLGNKYKIPVMKLTQNYDGGIGTTIEAVGKTEEETKIDFKGPTTKAVERTYEELILVNHLVATKVDAEWVKANTITTEQLTAVTAKIANIEANMITANYVEANFAKIDLANIANGSIKTAMIDTGAIGSAQIADGSITSAKIVEVTADKITSGTIDAARIDVINLNCANLIVGQINGQQIAPGAVDMSNLADPVTGKINSAVSDSAQALQDAITALTNANNAVSTATTAMTAANGKNTVIYSATTPATTGRVAGDTWFNTADGNKIYNFTGTTWVLDQLGTNAIADLSITNAKIGNVDAAKITTGYLDAARIEAKTITVDKLAVGDFSNLVKDSSFEMYTVNAYYYSVSAEQAHTGSKSLKLYGANYWNRCDLSDSMYDIKAGDEFYVEFWAYRADATCPVKVCFMQYGYDGSYVYDSTGEVSAVASCTNNTWIKYTAVVTMRLTGRVQPCIKMCQGTAMSGAWYLDDIIIRRRNRGELLVDGSVSALQLAADSVNATKVVAGSINTACLAANAVTAEKIAANSVTADKLTVGSGGNLYSTGYDTFEQMVVTDITYSKNTNVQLSLSKDYRYYGSKSLCLFLPSGYSDGYVYLGNTKNNYGKVRVTIGKMYRISCYALSSIAGQGQLYVCDNGSPKATATVTVSNTSWTRLELTYKATTNFLSIRIDNDVPGAYMYFDAFQIEEVSNVNQKASAFSPAGTTVINGGNIVANSITAAQIAAKTITGNQIAANSISTTELSVSSLSAISANLGTVTAGLIRSTNYVENTSGMELNLAVGTWKSKYLQIYENGRMACSNININGGILDIMPETDTTNVIRIGSGEWSSLQGVIMQRYKMRIGTLTTGTTIDAGNVTIDSLLSKNVVSPTGMEITGASGSVSVKNGNVTTGAGANLNSLKTGYDDLKNRLANGRIKFYWDDGGTYGYNVTVFIDNTYIGKIAMN